MKKFYGMEITDETEVHIPTQEYVFRKLPFKVIYDALLFFRFYWLEHNSEVGMFITYNNGIFGLSIPQQKVSYARVKWENTGQENVCGSIHSHHTMRGNFSPTDLEDNRKNPGLHLVIGDVETAGPSFDAELVISKDHVLKLGKDFSLEDILEDVDSGDLSCPDWSSKSSYGRISKEHGVSSPISGSYLPTLWDERGKYYPYREKDDKNPDREKDDKKKEKEEKEDRFMWDFTGD